jgi:hypothetical protein
LVGAVKITYITFFLYNSYEFSKLCRINSVIREDDMTKNRPTDPDYKPKDNRPDPVAQTEFMRRVGDGQQQPSAEGFDDGIDVCSGFPPTVLSRRPPGLD